MKIELSVRLADAFDGTTILICRCGNAAAFSVQGVHEDADGERTRYDVLMCSQCASDFEDMVDELRVVLGDGVNL